MWARVRNGKKYYYLSTYDQQRSEIPLGTNLKKAAEKYKKLMGNDYFIPPAFIGKLHAAVRKNAKPRGIEVFITKDDILEMVTRSEGKCALTGIRFEFTALPGARIRPWIPSIDRIDSRLPYTKENCRLICASVNTALNQFGEGVLRAIAHGILGRKHPTDYADLRNDTRFEELSEPAN